MTMLRILMATDFSRASKAAYQYCLMVAGGMPCNIIVVHVYKPRHSANLSDDQVQAFTHREMAEYAEKTRRFSGLYPDVVSPDVVSQSKFETVVAEGPVSDTLLALAESRAADLVVIGSKKHPGILKSWFGQISSTLIYSDTCPVLVVPEDNVEVGVDRIGLLSLTPADEDRLARWQEASSLAIEHPVICRLYSGVQPFQGLEHVQVADKPNNDAVQALNDTDCHLFAVVTSDANGAADRERRHFVHHLYRRSRKPFLCLNGKG